MSVNVSVRMNLPRSVPIVAVTVGLLLAAHASAGPVALLDDGSAGLRNGGAQDAVGYEFTVSAGEDLEVVALGIWDDASGNSADGTPDGLAESHEIGLWKSSDQSLVASVTAPSGNGGHVIGEYRYFDLSSSVTLTDGVSYVIGAQYVDQTDDWWHDNGGSNTVTFSNLITYENSRYAGGTGSSLSFPSNTGSNGPFVGPNFELIPEPASLALLAPAGLALVRRRRAA